MRDCALVTGAAGFIGSHLCEELSAEGSAVVGVDNLFRGKQENLQGLRHRDSFNFECVDLADRASIEAVANLVRVHRPARVFHYAAINGTKYFYQRPLEVLQRNIDMTANLLEGLVQGGFEGKVIYASSSEVYGDPLEIPTPETHPAAVRPGVDRDGYAASKVVGEMQMRLTAEAHGWDWLVLRIFNCYGPRMDNTEFGQVVPEFIRKVRSDDEFTIIGDGRQTRSFCFVGDIVTQTLRCTDDFNQDVVNIGNDAEVEILDVAQRIHSIAGREFRPEHLPAWPGDHRRRCPSLAKLRERLGDVPLVGLGEGLATTYEYYANDSEQRR